MKKLFFILCSLPLYLSSFAQSYKPCLDGEIIRWSFLDSHIPDAGILSSEIVAYGDISFNNVIYKKLYLDYSFEYNDTIDAEENNTNWKNHVSQLYYEWENFFIRESEDASRLYLYNSYWDEEYLISDMNLQKGDKFQAKSPYHETVDFTVDTVYVENNLKHIRFLYGSGYYMCIGDSCFVGQDHLTFIESVGSTIWFTYPYFYTFGLNCFQNQTTFYKNAEILNGIIFADFPCGSSRNFSGINSVHEDNYQIFIQKDKIEILFASDMNVDISIYNVSGKLFYSRNNVFDKKIIIPLSSFSKGIYVLSIFNRKNYQMDSKKFILQ